MRDVAATYLALGLDPERAVLFRQSDVPEVTELPWLLVDRHRHGPARARALLQGQGRARASRRASGLFTYPVLMAADILVYDTRPRAGRQGPGAARRDGAGHGHALQRAPTAATSSSAPSGSFSPTPKVPGLDGEKMTKSYGNTIWIFEEGKALKKAVNAIVTDTRPPEEPKDPDELNVFAILELFLDDAEQADWRARLAQGWSRLRPPEGARSWRRWKRASATARARYKRLMTTTDGNDELESVLLAGPRLARPIAQATLARCYDAVGMPNRGTRTH